MRTWVRIYIELKPPLWDLDELDKMSEDEIIKDFKQDWLALRESGAEYEVYREQDAPAPPSRDQDVNISSPGKD